MIIVHQLSDFLFELFPKAKENGKNDGILIKELQNYYAFGVYKPKVTIESDFVHVEIDIPTIINQKSDFDKAISFCEKRKFEQAKPVLHKLIADNPTISEYHRILGQIFSEEGNPEEAINCLIDALKWDPKNGYALIMMGNIFAKEKGDIDTALKYYNEAAVQNPKDHIAINNLGTNLIQIGKWDEGLKLLHKSYEINPNYPNTNYGIALANEKLGNTLLAFDYAIAALKKCGIHDQKLYDHTLSLSIKVAEEWTKSEAGEKVFNEYKSFLEKECGKMIKLEVNSNIPTAAKMEFAENYERDFHLIKYNKKYRAVEHLMMHELVHLDFVNQARKKNSNFLFVSDGNMKAKFEKDYFKSFTRLMGGGAMRHL
jgi:tetratricopeptide (TPR) repeat protein